MSDVLQRVENQSAAEQATRGGPPVTEPRPQPEPQPEQAPRPPQTADEKTNDAIDTILHHVPEMERRPDVTLDIAKNSDTSPDPIGTAQVAHMMGMIDELHRHDPMHEGMEHPGGPGLLGQIENDVANPVITGADDLGHWINEQRAAGQVGQNLMIGRATSAIGHGVSFSEKVPVIGEAVKGTMKVDEDIAHYGGDALHEVAKALQLPRWVGDAAGASTYVATGGNQGLANDVTRNVGNAVSSGFDFLQHQYRLFSEVQRRHGDGAAAAAVLPGLAGLLGAAIATAGGEPEAAPEVAAEGLSEEAAAASAAGAGEAGAAAATEAEGGAAASAGAEDTAAAEEEVNAARDVTESQLAFLRNLSRSNWATQLARGVDIAGQTLGAPVRALSAVGHMAQSPEVWSAYASQYAADKTIFAPEWKATADGAAWSARTGRPDTIGSFVGQLLPPGEARNALAGVINFGTYAALPDPFAITGRVLARVHTAEGLGGVANKFFPGTDMSKAEEAYRHVLPFRRAVHFIARENAGRIARAFPNLANIAGQLDDLKTYTEEGVSRHTVTRVDEEGNSYKYSTPLTPEGREPTVDHASTEVKILQYLKAKDTARLLTETSTLPMRGIGDLIREATRDKHFLQLFTTLPMYQAETEKGIQMVNGKFKFGDHSAIPAIGQSLRQAGYAPDAVEQAMNELLHNDDPRVWRAVLGNAWRGLYQTRLARALLAARVTPELGEAIDREMSRAINEQVAEIIGSPVGDKQGLYGIGRSNTPLSRVETSVGEDGLTATTRASAIWPRQLEEGLLPKYHEINDDVHKMVYDITKAIEKRTDFGGLRMVDTEAATSAQMGLTISHEVHTVAMAGDIVRYAVNHYVNDIFFKPLALATGGWAIRVSFSEILLNIYRQGGIRTIASHFAVGAAEKETKLMGMLDALRDGTASFEMKKIEDQVAAAEERTTGGSVTTLTPDEERQVIESTATEAARWFHQNKIGMPGPEEMTHFTAALLAVRLGFDRAIVKTLGEKALLDSASAALWLNQGHIAPFGLRSNHAGAYVDLATAPTIRERVNNQEVENTGYADTAKKQRVVLDRAFQQYDPEMKGYITLRWQRALFFQSDRWARPVVDVFSRTLERTRSIDDALTAARQKSLDLINKEGDHYSDFDRSRHVGKNDDNGNFVSTGDPKLDHANTMAMDVEGFLLGPRISESAQGVAGKTIDGRYYDATSAKMIRDGHVSASANGYAEAVHGGVTPDAFTSVVGPQAKDMRIGGTLIDTPRRMAEWLQDKALGKIVNNLSRDPTYLIDFHNERMTLAKRVADGTMSQAEADVLAQTRAFAKTRRFIHNPIDKTHWDELARVVAPFYFAQMQAWRRVGRLFFDNPGAFEQYLKLMVGVNAGIGRAGSLVAIPGFNMFGIPFQMALDSLQSVNPIPVSDSTSSVGGNNWWGQALSAVIPRVGPVIALPIKTVEDVLIKLGVEAPLAGEVGNATLGVANTLPFWTGFVPNSALQHLIEGVAGYLEGAHILNLGDDQLTSSFLSAQNTVLEYRFTEAYRKIYNSTEGVTLPKGSTLTLPQYRMSIALQEMVQKWDDPSFRDQMVTGAADATAAIWAARTTASFGSPVSISVGQVFPDVTAAYQKLLTQYKGNWIEAENKFLALYPWAIPLTVSRSKPTFGFSYPDTKGALQWTEDNRAIVDRWGTAAPLFMPLPYRGQPYDQFAYNSLNLLGLRQKDTPDDYLKALTFAMGDSFVYDVIYAAYDKEAAPLIKAGTSTYNLGVKYFGTNGLGGILGEFGKIAPLWFSNYQSHTAKANRAQALLEIQQMALPENNPWTPGSVNYEALRVMDAFAPIAQEIGNYEKSPTTYAKMVAAGTAKPGQGGYGYDATVVWWTGWMDRLAAGKFPRSWGIKNPKAVAQQLTYALNAVFRPYAENYSTNAQGSLQTAAGQ